MINSHRPQVLHLGKFYPPYRGGMETHLKDLCDHLRSEVDIEVVVAHNQLRTVEEVVDGIPVCRLAPAFTAASTSFCPDMVKRIRVSKADLVHIHLPNPAAVLAYLMSGRRGRLICSYHSDVIRQKILNTGFEPLQRMLLRRSSAILVASPNYIESSATLRRFRKRCHIVPYGILPPAEPPRSTIEGVRQKYGSEPLILCVGRLVYYKGFEYAIRAMRHVARGRLLLVGEGPLGRELRALAGELGVADRVSFLGNVDNQGLGDLYHAVDVFVLPSVARSEAFGIVQAEAMAAGKPVVNTQLDSGVPFVSLNGITGFTVPPADSEALGAALNRIVSDPVLMSRLGTAARARAEQEFSIPTMVSRVLRIYAKTLHQDPGVPVAPMWKIDNEVSQSNPSTAMQARV